MPHRHQPDVFGRKRMHPQETQLMDQAHSVANAGGQPHSHSMDRLSVLTHSSRSARPGLTSTGGGGGSTSISQSDATATTAQQQQHYVLDPSAESPVDAFSFDQRHLADADGAYSLVHHVFHKETTSLRRYYRGDVSMFNLPSEDGGSRNGSLNDSSRRSSATGDARDNWNWYVAYTVSSSVVFRSLKVQIVRDSDGKDARRLPPPKVWLRFRSLPTCQAFNPSATKQANLELAVGFQNGSTFVFCPFEVKDPKPKNIVGLMFNQGYPSAVNALKWHPSSKHIFASAHEDGNLMIFDKSKRYPNPSDLNLGANDGTESQRRNSKVKNSDTSADPILRWKVSSSSIVDFEFSTDGNFAATVHRDGRVFILHMESHERVASFKSYFGGLFTVSWSPDDKFLAVGGEDDLISIWDVQTQRLLARGYGHRSWVSRVSFHPVVANREYRLMSVGHDGRLAVWRFKDPDAIYRADDDEKGIPDGFLKLQPEGIYPIHEEPIRGFGLSFFLMTSLCSENHLKVWSWEPNKATDEKTLFPDE
eukprot:TRINITY_DN7503_c0_g4_i2.p1 TRINITY_DN7503_c0_g4~~TRINITY_DN7503_c0_g4_i2.p1  ORF type:complete len:534 (-),score=123.39 TRINITY_DN7503_c0_g4_i2:686-2287(-)